MINIFDRYFIARKVDCLFPEAKSDQIAISPKETSLNSGDELNLFCQPDDSSLNVWWTAKDASGNNIDVTAGFDRVAVS